VDGRGRLHGLKTTLDFLAASRATNLRVAHSSKQSEILVTRSVARINWTTHEVFLDGGDVVRARTLILATGVRWRRLALGKGVYYGAA
jgi:alkyl hydroperoxide reductase subunit AhpF